MSVVGYFSITGYILQQIFVKAIIGLLKAVTNTKVQLEDASIC